MSPRERRYPVSVAIAPTPSKPTGAGPVFGRGAPPAHALKSAAPTAQGTARLRATSDGRLRSGRRRRGALSNLPSQLGNAFIECPRVVHRAELGPAHRAELGTLEVLGRGSITTILSRPRTFKAAPSALV